jgi:hypothetical protein
MDIDSTMLTKAINLLPGAAESDIRSIEEKLDYRFPDEYVEFLRRADGGQLTNEVILFSCGPGLHPAERLEAANADRGEPIPLILIGRFAEEEFGFMKGDGSSSRTVWIYLHDDGGARKLAESFEDFVRKQLR